MTPAHPEGARLATRLAFLAAGFSVACWAPLIPFAKLRLGVDDGGLGGLLLCLGVGSVLTMPLMGVLSARFGSKWIILGGGIGLAVILPLLAVAGTPVALAIALLAFGACLGSIDVAMNVHAVEVERGSHRPLMSGFHAMWSLGGFAGAGFMTALFSAGVSAGASASLGALLVIGALALAAPRLLVGAHGEEGPLLVWPRGIVLLLAGLAGTIFLIEGAILDWSALLIIDAKRVAAAQGGLGYVMFSVAMTMGRLGGDRFVAAVGDQRTLLIGGVTAVVGLVLLLVAPVDALAMAGFVLIGLGAANLVPVLFRQAGAQRVMPPGLAVAAITTVGYAGVLAGPAGIGFVAHAIGLPAAFWGLTLLMALVPLVAPVAVVSRQPASTPV
jgi:predicted MFS family arabinose efflux permease